VIKGSTLAYGNTSPRAKDLWFQLGLEYRAEWRPTLKM